MSFFFFFNDTATTEIYTLSLHDALPISAEVLGAIAVAREVTGKPIVVYPNSGEEWDAKSRTWVGSPGFPDELIDRKSTRLNSSHANISYAVFCLKKKTNSI